jgi:hypothetical protein
MLREIAGPIVKGVEGEFILGHEASFGVEKRFEN